MFKFAKKRKNLLVVSSSDGAGWPETASLMTVLVGHHMTAVSVVDEVAPRSVGTVSGDPVLLAELGLVLVVPYHVLLQIEPEVSADLSDNGKSTHTHPEFVLPVSKLTELPVEAGPLLLEVAADLCLESDKENIES